MHVFMLWLQPLFACCGDMGYNESIICIDKTIIF